MKIFIVGLGLMGASYALGLKDSFKVYGYDKNKEVVKKAIDEGLIISDQLEEIKTADLILLALYPKDNISFLNEYKHLFNHQVITDLSGTKVWMIDQIEKIMPETIRYISHHPMAGKESSGYDYKNIEMFKGANFLIIPTKYTDQTSYDYLDEVHKTLGFGKKTIMTGDQHDELIAFTSQLTHVIAVSLVNSDTHLLTKEATGDSYRDLTRIAKINEVMWTELFIENKEKLLVQIDQITEELTKMKRLIATEDKPKLKEKLKQATEKRKQFDKD